MKGIFISGTDTDVGKTICSAIIAKYFSNIFPKVVYQKAIQTFMEQESDERVVQELSANTKNIKTFTALSFKRPLSPHLSAHYQNQRIDFSFVLKSIKDRAQNDFTIVEGAGGLLVPINQNKLVIDLAKFLQLPCVLVSRSTLGCINHTLLSLQALKKYDVKPLGVIFVGPTNKDNEESVRFYGKIKNIIRVPFFSKVSEEKINSYLEENKSNWRKFFVQI